MLRICSLSTVLAVSVLAAIAVIDVPHVINYLGRLTEMDKTPVDGEVTLTFRIYDDQEAVLWSETDTVQVDNGLFDVVLGTRNPIPDTIFK